MRTRHGGRIEPARWRAVERSVTAATPSDERMRRFLSIAVVLTVLAGLFVATSGPADADGSIALGPGVKLSHQTFRFHGPQSVWTLSVDLSAHTRLVSTTPQRKIGARRADLLALARQERAIGGMKRGTPDFTPPAEPPR